MKPLPVKPAPSLVTPAPSALPQKTIKIIQNRMPSSDQLAMTRPMPVKPAAHITLTSAGSQARNSNVYSQPFPPQMVTMSYQPQQQANAPAVIVQCVPTPAMMPAYVDAFQQHTGQTLQHLATIDAHIPIEGAYITAVPNPVIPRTFHLQATPDGQLRLEPTPQLGMPQVGMHQVGMPQVGMPQLGLSLQLGQHQPQMVGILPNGLAYTTTDGMYPAGNVLVTNPINNQPVLTCMETVVSNTYMSMSQNQFMPGMLAGSSSSFSSTTTQVFQRKPNPDVATSFVSQLPDQLAVPSQAPSDQPSPRLSDQAKPTDVFTQPEATQPQTLSLSLPPVLSQAPAQCRPVVQRTYSKSAKNPAPIGVASSKPMLPVTKPTPPPSPPKPAPLESQIGNLLIGPAPAQSITLPDPIAPPVAPDEALASPKAATPVARNALPKSIAVVHPIPVSTYAPPKKPSQPGVNPPPSLAVISDMKEMAPRSPNPVTLVKSALIPDPLKVFDQLDAEKLSVVELSKLEPPSSVPSSSETPSFACKVSPPRPTWPAHAPAPTQVTASCPRPVITVACTAKPVSTVLPTNCLASTKESVLPPASAVAPTPFEPTPKIDLPPCSGDALSNVTVAPPSVTNPSTGKSVDRASSPETKKSSEPPTTLKLLFQKQAHSGRYKVSASKLDPFTRPENGCLREKNGEKDEPVGALGGVAEGSENVKPGDKTGKKPNNSAPKIVYEIHSQDGFTCSSTSISDAWQKVSISVSYKLFLIKWLSQSNSLVFKFRIFGSLFLKRTLLTYFMN